MEQKRVGGPPHNGGPPVPPAGNWLIARKVMVKRPSHSSGVDYEQAALWKLCAFYCAQLGT